MALKQFDSFRDRFSRTTPSISPVTFRRKVSRGISQATYSPKAREGFYGRLWTAEPKRINLADAAFGRASGWVREARNIWGGSWGSGWQVLLMFVVAFTLVFGLARPFVAEPMRVPSASMAPTLKPHDHVLTNKLAYDLFSTPERGDLAVFESVDPKREDKLVKRVVGLPGDEVRVENGVLLVNGAPPYEPYKKVRPGEPSGQKVRAPARAESFGPAVVPEGHVFVLGDNRNDSYDSRFFGPVPKDNLEGEITLRFWPPNRLGTP